MTPVASSMRAALIEPGDRRWRDMLSIRHDFYHLPEYVSLESDRLGGNALAAFVDEPGVRLFVPLVGRAIPGSDDRDVVSPYGYPAPIAEFADVSLLRAALSAVVQALQAKGFVSLFVRMHPLLEIPDDAFTGLGALITHGETVSIDLLQSEADQLRGMRSTLRNFLKKTAPVDHQVFFDDDGEHLDRFATLYLDTMRRQNAAAKYFFTREYLRGTWEKLGGSAHLGVVKIEGSVVSAGLFGESNGIVQYHLSGSAEEATRLSPVKLLLNHARQWAAQRGAHTLHLGGGVGGGAKDSLMHFKAGFSDRRHLFKTWRVVLNDRRYQELAATRAPDGYFPAYRGAARHDS